MARSVVASVEADAVVPKTVVGGVVDVVVAAAGSPIHPIPAYASVLVPVPVPVLVPAGVLGPVHALVAPASAPSAVSSR